ncbi:MAG: hypothetical protein JWL99_585, partial [Streptomyces oryziradicis]|nr:hypothetical protein [Actinacidiphila oryziradicis]
RKANAPHPGVRTPREHAPQGAVTAGGGCARVSGRLCRQRPLHHAPSPAAYGDTVCRTPLHSPLRPSQRLAVRVPLGSEPRGAGRWLYGLRHERPSRAMTAGRGRAGVSPQGTSACTPGKRAVDPHARAPRRSPHSGPDPATDMAWAARTTTQPVRRLRGRPPQRGRNRAGPAGQTQPVRQPPQRGRGTGTPAPEHPAAPVRPDKRHPRTGGPGTAPASPARAT